MGINTTMTEPIFPEVADTYIPKERRGRPKLPSCPVCKTPRDLRERVINECIAAVNNGFFDTLETVLPTVLPPYKRKMEAIDKDQVLSALSSLKAEALKETPKE